MPTFNWNEPSDEYDSRDLPLLDKNGIILREGDKIKFDLFPELVFILSFNESYQCWTAVNPDVLRVPQNIEGLTHKIELILDNG